MEEGSTTRELLRSAHQGEEQAWNALYLRYRKVLLGMLKRHVPHLAGGASDTDDLVQSTFLAAWRSLDAFEYRGPDSFRRWLGTILSHRLADHARAQEREQERQRSLRDEAENAARAAAAGTGEQHERLLEALATLSLEDQDLIGMRYFDGLEVSEIAERLGLSPTTARRRLLDALERLMRRVL